MASLPVQNLFDDSRDGIQERKQVCGTMKHELNDRFLEVICRTKTEDSSAMAKTRGEG